MFLSHANVSYKTCICKCNIKHAYVGDGLKPYWLNSLEKARSSRARMFFKIGVLKNFANYTGKHLCWSLFLLNSNLSNIVEFLRKCLFTEHLRRLLLSLNSTFSKLPTWTCKTSSNIKLIAIWLLFHKQSHKGIP